MIIPEADYHLTYDESTWEYTWAPAVRYTINCNDPVICAVSGVIGRLPMALCG